MGASLPHTLETLRPPGLGPEIRSHLLLADATNDTVALMSPLGTHLRDELRRDDWDARCEHRNRRHEATKNTHHLSFPRGFEYTSI